MNKWNIRLNQETEGHPVGEECVLQEIDMENDQFKMVFHNGDEVPITINNFYNGGKKVGFINKCNSTD